MAFLWFKQRVFEIINKRFADQIKITLAQIISKIGLKSILLHYFSNKTTF